MKVIAALGFVLVALVAVAVIALSERGNTEQAGDALDLDEGIEQVTPASILDVPERFFRTSVRIDGEVAAVDAEDGRFALEGGQTTVLVEPEPGLTGVEEGQRVQVVGRVNRISRVQADDMSGFETAAPTEEGDPYVSADDLAVR